MSYGDHKLYLYENIIEMVVTTDGIYVDNRPMNNRKLVAHKGTTNEIIFNIRNRDRKLQNVFSDTITATLINPTTKRRIFYRLLEHTSDVGKVKLTLEDSDLQNVDAGLYTIFLQRKRQDGYEYPVYTDQDNSVKFNIEITDQVGLEPVETQMSNTFTQTASVGSGDAANVFVTSAFSGNQDRNFQTALHSVAVYNRYYNGNITIQGSCIEGAPESDDASADWFNLETIELSSKKILYSNVIVSENIANSNISNGNIISNITSFILSDKENSNAQINYSNLDVSSATTVSDVVTIINDSKNTNTNVVASVFTSDASNIRSYKIKLVGNDFELGGDITTLNNLGFSSGRYQSDQSNIIHKNYQVNANWVRLIHTPTSGNITQVLVRN